jgi:hypothetical protein
MSEQPPTPRVAPRLFAALVAISAGVIALVVAILLVKGALSY